ncbi:MAG TPA: hypothetical protein VKQ54_08280 [Caulobacteraceae bacterium]|nr:hypothetical protein [Caulobacteraceae bacterium]
MNVNADVSSDALTFQQQRVKLVLVAIIGIAFVAIGTSFLLRPEIWKSYRQSVEFIRVVGWVTVALFSFAMIVSIL